jgi:hypothetical protein
MDSVRKGRNLLPGNKRRAFNPEASGTATIQVQACLRIRHIRHTISHKYEADMAGEFAAAGSEGWVESATQS